MEQTENIPDIGLISIITPVFNAAECLPRCIDSVLSQTYRNWEMILVDDGSADATPEVCRAYAGGDSRIHVIRTENRGPAAARNSGLAEASGRFCYFLDADDALEKDTLSLMAAEYARSSPDLIVGGLKRISGDQVVPEAYYEEYMVFDHSALLRYLEQYLQKPNRTPMFSSVWGKLYCAEIIRQNQIFFNSELHVFEDADFNFRFLRNVKKMVYLDVYSYLYTFMVTYVSASTKVIDHPEKMFDHLTAMRSLAKLFQPVYPDKKPEQIVGHACISLTIIQLVRTCGQLGYRARYLVRRLVNNEMVRECLPYYSPGEGESKAIPFLIKLKLAVLIIAVCRYKARKRYGKCKK